MSLGRNRQRLRARFGGGGGGGGVAPVNTGVPTIVGSAVDGTNLIMNVGTWTGTITGFEAEIRATDLSATYFARQAVTWSSSFTVPTAAVGKSLELRVWASNGGAVSSVATSAAFGPILASDGIFVIALAFNKAAQSFAGQPYAWTNVTLATDPQSFDDYAWNNGAGRTNGLDNPNDPSGPVKWGLQGSSFTSGAAAAICTTMSTVGADVRRQGRFSTNLSRAQFNVRVGGLTLGKTYRIYSSSGRNMSATNAQFAVYDGAGTLLYDTGSIAVGNGILGGGPSPTGTVYNSGTVATDETNWSAASLLGGPFVEVACPADQTFTFARGATAVTSQINCIAILEKV